MSDNPEVNSNDKCTDSFYAFKSDGSQQITYNVEISKPIKIEKQQQQLKTLSRP